MWPPRTSAAGGTVLKMLIDGWAGIFGRGKTLVQNVSNERSIVPDTEQMVADIIKNVPDLVSHRFEADDGYVSVAIHDVDEVVERAAKALVVHLGLKQQRRLDIADLSLRKYEVRYVTDWKPEDD
jgi:hypothetical protein